MQEIAQEENRIPLPAKASSSLRFLIYGEATILSTSLNVNLPEVLKSVRTRPLFVMRLDLRKVLNIGATPGGVRRIAVLPGGSFEREPLSGEVLDGGSDWQAVDDGGATTLNVRLVLKTADDALIGMTYQGVRHGPPAVLDRIAKGEVVDPTSYYPRTSALLETAAPKYDSINRIVAAGIGHREASGPISSVFKDL